MLPRSYKEAKLNEDSPSYKYINTVTRDIYQEEGDTIPHHAKTNKIRTKYA